MEASRVTRASRVTASGSLRLCVRPLKESHAEAQRRREESLADREGQTAGEVQWRRQFRVQQVAFRLAREAARRRVAAVNRAGGFGTWHYGVVTDPAALMKLLDEVSAAPRPAVSLT